MTNFPCSGDWLVEYADGELPAAETEQAELHLATCLRCSREVAALRSSRELLSSYFASADDVRAAAPAVKLAAPQLSWNTAGLALASLAATALLISMFFLGERESGEVVTKVSPPAEIPATAPSIATEPAEEDVLAIISRETQIARLRTASEILAKEPGMTERHLAMEKYLAEEYGATTMLRPFEM